MCLSVCLSVCLCLCLCLCVVVVVVVVVVCRIGDIIKHIASTDTSDNTNPAPVISARRGVSPYVADRMLKSKNQPACNFCLEGFTLCPPAPPPPPPPHHFTPTTVFEYKMSVSGIRKHILITGLMYFVTL